MIITLNNGIQIDIPKIFSGEIENQALTVYRYGADSYFQYDRTSGSYVQFGILVDFMNKVDELNNPVSSHDYIYHICHELFNYPHTMDYYTNPNESGYQIIQYLKEHTVWVMGDFNTGGFGMYKIGNEYGFINYEGTFQSDNDSTLYRVVYTPTAYSLEGTNYGTLTRNEITHSGFGWYRDIEAEYPPLTLFYQDDSYMPIANAGFKDSKDPLDLLVKMADWQEMNIEGAMGDGSWFSATLDMVYLPTRPWKNTPTLEVTGDTWFTEYTKIDGTPYGDAELDEDENPYGNGGYATTGGGGGGFDTNCDSNPATGEGQFTIDAINSGFFTLYNPTKSEIKSFNDFLFSGITEDMSAVLKRLVTNPLDYVLFISMCHFQPNFTERGVIKFCGLDSGIVSNKVAHQMQKIDCGVIELDEQAETKSFLSYNPYYKISIYLPYIGIIPLNTDEVMDGKIHLVYWIDLMTGSCIAQLEVTRSSRQIGDADLKPNVIGEYQGNCYLNMPLTATDWRGLFQSVVQFAGGAAAVATGNVAGGLASVASSVTNEKMTAAHSGQMGTNYGYMGKQTPYLILERPIIQTPEIFGNYEGYPSNIYKQIGEMTGYTEIDTDTLWVGTYDDPMNGITEAEANMLKEIVGSGFYIN